MLLCKITIYQIEYISKSDYFKESSKKIILFENIMLTGIEVKTSKKSSGINKTFIYTIGSLPSYM